MEDTVADFFGKVFQPATTARAVQGQSFQYPYLGLVEKASTGQVLKMLADSAVSRKFPADVQFALGDLDQNLQLSSQYQFLYALRKNADPISNRNITKADAETDEADRPIIAMDLDAAGARRWEKMTAKNIGRAIAISINNKVIIAPQVEQAISGGKSRISMYGEENCRVVSVLLTSSELKLPVQIIQSQVKKEGKFSPKVFTGYINYILVFILSFAISFCVTWFVFKPGKKLSRNV